MTYSLYNSDLSFNTYADMSLLFLSPDAWCLAEWSLWWLLPIGFLAALNRETSLVHCLFPGGLAGGELGPQLALLHAAYRNRRRVLRRAGGDAEIPACDDSSRGSALESALAQPARLADAPLEPDVAVHANPVGPDAFCPSHRGALEFPWSAGMAPAACSGSWCRLGSRSIS